jgi:hypothetical protein
LRTDGKFVILVNKALMAALWYLFAGRIILVSSDRPKLVGSPVHGLIEEGTR